MTALKNEALPKMIAPNDLVEMIGEHLHWYCPNCRKWRTSKVKPGGSVTCSVCGGEPDWKKRPPTLAYRSRLKRVEALCAEDSEWRAWYDDAERRYGEYIDDVAAGLLPRQAKEFGWKHFHEVWREVDRLADYLLSAKDAPATHVPHAYSEAGLQRRYQDPSRKHNVVTLSNLNLKAEFDDGGAQYSDEELLELMAFDPADCDQFIDKYFQYEFLENIENPLERDIAYWLSAGEGKRDIEKMYGLSEQQVKTICKHIRNALDKKSLKSA